MGERQQRRVAPADAHTLDGQVRRERLGVRDGWAHPPPHGFTLCHDDRGIEDLDSGGEVGGAVALHDPGRPPALSTVVQGRLRGHFTVRAADRRHSGAEKKVHEGERLEEVHDAAADGQPFPGVVRAGGPPQERPQQARRATEVGVAPGQTVLLGESTMRARVQDRRRAVLHGDLGGSVSVFLPHHHDPERSGVDGEIVVGPHMMQLALEECARVRGATRLVVAADKARSAQHSRVEVPRVQRQLLWPLGDNYFGRFRCDLDRCREYGDGLTSLWTARAPSTGS